MTDRLSRDAGISFPSLESRESGPLSSLTPIAASCPVECLHMLQWQIRPALGSEEVAKGALKVLRPQWQLALTSILVISYEDKRGGYHLRASSLSCYIRLAETCGV